MELIYKKDALHAVLHNTGDAAVAAVENIKAVDAVPLDWLIRYLDGFIETLGETTTHAVVVQGIKRGIVILFCADGERKEQSNESND